MESAKEKKILWLSLVFIFLCHILFMFYDGLYSCGGGDSTAYINAGIVFAQQGIISIWSDAQTAMVMPGVPFLTGILSLLFGSGNTYIVACKIVWILMGTVTAYFSYRIIRLFLPQWCGMLILCTYLLPNVIWGNTVIETETPYLLFFTMALYFSFCMKDGLTAKMVILYAVSVTLALTIRANALLLIPFTFVYLLITKKTLKAALKCLAVTILALSIFVVPWAIRNHSIFHDFTLLTDGAGNPNLQGTYQGSNPLPDDGLDYESVEQEFKQEHAEYYYEDGSENCTLTIATHLHLLLNDKIALYRIRTWIQQDLGGFLKTYFYEKIRYMINDVWFWMSMNDSIGIYIRRFYQMNFLLCGVGVVLSVWKKRYRAEMLSLAGLYWIYVLMFALSYACERYNAIIMPIRHIIAVFALYLLVSLWKERRSQSGKKKTENDSASHEQIC